MTYAQAMAEARLAYVKETLTKTRGNVMRAAAIAGHHKSVFYKLMYRCGFKPQRRRQV